MRASSPSCGPGSGCRSRGLGRQRTQRCFLGCLLAYRMVLCYAWCHCSWSMSRGEAQQLELIGMTSVAEVNSAAMQSRFVVAASAESADAVAASAASFETEE